MSTTRTRKARPLEAEIQRNALAWLKAQGIAAWRRNVAAMPIPAAGGQKRRFLRAAEPGQSDLWALLPVACGGNPGCRHLEIEIKRPGERPTLAQVLWLTEINRLTGAAFWIDSLAILERVVACLRAGGRVEYLETTRRYGEATGPSGDYDCVWPDLT